MPEGAKSNGAAHLSHHSAYICLVHRRDDAGFRDYSIDQIRSYFKDFTIEEFALIPDGRHNLGLVTNPSDDLANQQNYGCGCFWLRRGK